MICSICGRPEVRWRGPLTNLTHTQCDHCGGRNCQIVDLAQEDYDIDECALSRATGGVDAG